MRTFSTLKYAVGVLVMASASTAWADPPEYDADPFGDADFTDAPLILDVAHPTRGRGELGLMFASTVIDKYTSHVGGTVDFQYQFRDTMGIGLSLSFMHGALTTIVTDQAGILGPDNKLKRCTDEGTSDCTPNVPDYQQMTGSVDATFIWSPLYGKVNVVSEADVNLQFYGLAGLGANGTRTVTATLAGTPEGYELAGDGLGEGGLFSDLKVHGALGVGMKIYMSDFFALRGEVRGIGWPDEFAFNKDPNAKETYLSWRYVAQVGAQFTLF